MVRFKNRYILAEIQWDSDKHGEFTGYQLLNHIKDSLLANFGDFGLGATMSSLQGIDDIFYVLISSKIFQYCDKSVHPKNIKRLPSTSLECNYIYNSIK